MMAFSEYNQINMCVFFQGKMCLTLKQILVFVFCCIMVILVIKNLRIFEEIGSIVYYDVSYYILGFVRVISKQILY